MDDKKKKYVKPEGDIVDFANEDIITESNHIDWIGDDNTEDWA